jgi:hypothetical protein
MSPPHPTPTIMTNSTQIPNNTLTCTYIFPTPPTSHRCLNGSCETHLFIITSVFFDLLSVFVALSCVDVVAVEE